MELKRQALLCQKFNLWKEKSFVVRVWQSRMWIRFRYSVKYVLIRMSGNVWGTIFLACLTSLFKVPSPFLMKRSYIALWVSIALMISIITKKVKARILLTFDRNLRNLFGTCEKLPKIQGKGGWLLKLKFCAEAVNDFFWFDFASHLILSRFNNCFNHNNYYNHGNHYNYCKRHLLRLIKSVTL